jgi:UDP-N-acetyl-2-amino-2-deoxyglucuronate dehydrogenase
MAVIHRSHQMRFAIIGVGNIAPIHAAAIRSVPEAELVAVATRREDRGRAFVAEHGGTWYADYGELLARAEPDVVAICTPHDLHAPMTLAAAQAGVHVLCEKPMARNVAECDAMIAACDRARVTLGVVFQGRFEPLSIRLKAALDAERLGRLLWVSANTLWHRTDAYYRSGPWRGTWAHEGGGVLINQAVHGIDLLIWLAGLPERVTARARTLNHPIEVEDAALAILEYAHGGLGLIQATTIAHPGYPERFEFFGSRGSVIYHKGQARIEWRLLDPVEDSTEEAEVSSGAARPMDITAAGHTALYNNFISAIHAGRPPQVDGHEGRHSVALVEAIYRSAAAGNTSALE